ncbi:hypothetical protein SETIT_1G237700v2 [Setaria italica]|uniref:Uncharacterized protein n=1 Tax=Setaria italica TaxID=4555 RepID=A0A368PPJ4_SETIT|nr:hypothetical protein SETIT_1G237700v2 [Setaria italica]
MTKEDDGQPALPPPGGPSPLPVAGLPAPAAGPPPAHAGPPPAHAGCRPAAPFADPAPAESALRPPCLTTPRRPPPASVRRARPSQAAAILASSHQEISGTVFFLCTGNHLLSDNNGLRLRDQHPYVTPILATVICKSNIHGSFLF